MGLNCIWQAYSLSKVYRFLDNLCYRPEEGEEEVVEKKGENVPGANEGRKSGARQKKGQDYKTIVEQVSYEHTKKVVGGEEGKTIIPVVQALADRFG